MSDESYKIAILQGDNGIKSYQAQVETWSSGNGGQARPGFLLKDDRPTRIFV